MTERPIPFSAPMVRAILEGRKTQTRRLVKAPTPAHGACLGDIEPHPEYDGEWFYWFDGGLRGPSFTCPHGIPGDQLWVKEAFTFINAQREHNELCIGYDADGPDLPNRPSVFVTPEQFVDFMGDERPKIDPFKRRKYPPMFMNRFFSRITLELEEVRVERLNDISEGDAIAEGLACVTKDGTLYKYGIPDRDGLPGTDDLGWPWREWQADPRMAYRKLWEQIHGPGGWAVNPWVWVERFRQVEVG